MKLPSLVLTAGLAFSLTACDRIKPLLGMSEPVPVVPVTAVPQATATSAAPLPDVGKVGAQTVNASGTGASGAEAVDEAIRMALRMANGQTVDLSSDQFKVTLSLARGNNAEALRANVFAERIVQSSGGAITEFKISNLAGPDSKGFYKAEIEAKVAKYVPPADSKKLRIVVAPLRYDTASFSMGGRTVPADKIAEELRQQVVAALTNSGRFTVLDRELNSDVNQELELISSGQTPRAEFGKLGQALSADVVWVGHINSFAYNRHARELQTSDRQLVSFSGGWELSQKLVNVSTRQIMISESLRGTAPSMAPTTLGASVDGDKVSADMRASIAEKIVSGIVSRTFPVTVISREGNAVVLSQGAAAVKENTRYKLVYMGKEMFDPQTNQSLGRIESDCCEVVVDRVTPNMAQGHLENMQMPLDGFQPGSLQLRGLVAGKVAAANAVDGVASAKTARSVKPTSTPREAAPNRPVVPDVKW